MGKVIELQLKKHFYELDECVGCGKDASLGYSEIEIPDEETGDIKHLALCDRCTEMLSVYG